MYAYNTATTRLGCKNNMLKKTGVDNDSHRATIYIYELYISGWNLNLDHTHVYIIYVIHNILDTVI